LVHNKAKINQIRTNDDFGFKPKRQSQNSHMKPGHVYDKKIIDALTKKYNWSRDKRQKFHEHIDSLKGQGETLSWKELDELARDF
jgi:hypothetical protein